MDVVPFLELQVGARLRTTAMEHLLRVYGDSTHRIAQAEAGWWNSEVIGPALAAGKGWEELASSEFADRGTPLAERAVLGLYHAHQARAWTANLVEGFEALMAKALQDSGLR
jgi:adenylate cyclase